MNYERERNKLIPIAEQHANATVHKSDCLSEDDYKARWNRTFHQRMNQLWRERNRR